MANIYIKLIFLVMIVPEHFANYPPNGPRIPENFAIYPPKDTMIGRKARNALQGTKTALRRTVRAPFIIGTNAVLTVCLAPSMIIPTIAVAVAGWDVCVLVAHAIMIPFPFVFGLLHTPRDLWKRSHGENWDPTMRNYHHYNLEIDRNYLKKNRFLFYREGFGTELSEIEKYIGGYRMLNMIESVKPHLAIERPDAVRDFFAKQWTNEVYMAIFLKDRISQGALKSKEQSTENSEYKYLFADVASVYYTVGANFLSRKGNQYLLEIAQRGESYRIQVLNAYYDFRWIMNPNPPRFCDRKMKLPKKLVIKSVKSQLYLILHRLLRDTSVSEREHKKQATALIEFARSLDPGVSEDIPIPEYGHLWQEDEETEIKKYIEESSGFLKDFRKDQVSFRNKIRRAIKSQKWEDQKLKQAVQDLIQVAKKDEPLAILMMHYRLNGLEDDMISLMMKNDKGLTESLQTAWDQFMSRRNCI
jgi:hypothetical protein